MYTLDYIDFALSYGTILLFVMMYRRFDVLFRNVLLFLLVLTAGNTLLFVSHVYFGVRNNLFLSHFFTPLEYLCVGFIFYRALQSKKIKRAILISMPAFAISCVFLSLFVDKLSENNSNSKMIEALLSTTWIILYLKELSTSEKMTYIRTNRLYWAATGLMFYFPGTFCLQGLLNYVIRNLDPEWANQIYSLQYLCEYVLLLSIIIGIFCTRLFKHELSK